MRTMPERTREHDEIDAACARAMGWTVRPPAIGFSAWSMDAGLFVVGGIQERGDGDAYECDSLRAYSTDPATRDEMLAWLRQRGCLQLGLAQESLARIVVAVAAAE